MNVTTRPHLDVQCARDLRWKSHRHQQILDVKYLKNNDKTKCVYIWKDCHEYEAFTFIYIRSWILSNKLRNSQIRLDCCYCLRHESELCLQPNWLRKQDDSPSEAKMIKGISMYMRIYQKSKHCKREKSVLTKIEIDLIAWTAAARISKIRCIYKFRYVFESDTPTYTICVNGLWYPTEKSAPNDQRSHKNQTNTEIYACKCPFPPRVCVRSCRILGPQRFYFLSVCASPNGNHVLCSSEVTRIRLNHTTNWVYKATKFGENVYKIRFSQQLRYSAHITNTHNERLWKRSRILFICIADLLLHIKFTLA